MSNMNYCRFQNIYPDLLDCYENLEETELSPEEEKAREQIIQLCSKIANEYGKEE